MDIKKKLGAFSVLAVITFCLIVSITRPLQSVFTANKEYLQLIHFIIQNDISPLGTILAIEELDTEPQVDISESYGKLKKYPLSGKAYDSSLNSTFIGSGAIFAIIALNSNNNHKNIANLVEQLARKNSVVKVWSSANKLKEGSDITGIDARPFYPIISYLKLVDQNTTHSAIIDDRIQQLEKIPDATIQFELGDYYGQQGQFEKALVHLSNSIEQSSSQSLNYHAIQLKIENLIALGLNCQAVELAQQLVTTTPNALTYHWLSTAYLTGECADQEASLSAALIAHELDPLHFWFAFAAGHILMDLGRLEEANKLIERGAIQAPERFETSFVRGRLALLEKDFPSAINYFQDTVQKEPSVANHWIFLSRAIFLAGDEIQAKEVLCQGILMETDHPITNNFFPDLDCDSQ